VQSAEKEGISTQALCDRNAKAFSDLALAYNISFDNFQRSSSPDHFLSSQKLWSLCEASGDIYKKKYKGLYCVGCEVFYTPEELNEKQECFEHPGKKLDEVEEENYFFKLTKYQAELERVITSGEYKITPEHRKNEALGFIKQGLVDFSISRSVARAHGWGVPVPSDPTQIMYVWFDALNVYRSGAPEKFWPADLHHIGKGIIRFHAIYWPAILLSAKLALPKELLVHGYITVDGQKMSKSLGNVVDPIELVGKYGVDAVRYYLLREIPTDNDGDWSEEKFKVRYNADLANGLGNYTARVLTLAKKATGTVVLSSVEGPNDSEIAVAISDMKSNVQKAVVERKIHEALAEIWKLISFGDRYINSKKPWEMETGSAEQKDVMGNCLNILHAIATQLAPFLPATSSAILAVPTAPIFPRIA
jgi:methionyl-tRNA synthetase